MAHSSADLWSAFCQTVKRRGDHPALVRGDRTLSFRDWKVRAEACAARLAALGVRPRDRVLLWVDNDLDLAAAAVGVWALGGIVALLDGNCREPQLRHAIDTIRPVVVVCRPERLPGVARLSIPGFVASECAGQIAPERDSAPQALSIEPASIVFTSGSTGRAKGVVQSHGNLLRGCHAVASYLGLGDDDRILCPVPWSFDYGFGQLLSTVVLGIAHVIPREAHPFSACQAIEESVPTVLAGVPALYSWFTNGVSTIRTTNTSSLRTVTTSGGRIPRPVLRELRSLFSHCRIFLNYGLTETYRSCYLDPALIDLRPDSLGKPIPGVAIAIVRDDGQLAAPSEIGEIVHRGDYVCLGYWGDAESTARAVRPDPLAPPDCPNPAPSLFTGDYGTQDEEGFVYFKGRRDHQLKSMGVRVSPVEVEELLYASGLVAEAAVFGVPHDLLGDEIWAAVVPAAGLADPQRAIERYSRGAMSPFMLPRRYLLKDTLPRTTTGKVDYPALKEEASRSPSAAIHRETVSG